jgi:RNA polymerase subunit RPABC4/transcription elongation factor Spt4
MSRAIKVKDLKGKKLLSKSESEGLRGNVVVLDAEKSEIAKHLDIKENGGYAIKT